MEAAQAPRTDATPADGRSPRVPARAAAGTLVALGFAAIACSGLPADNATGAAVKVVLPALSLALVPGALLALAWRARAALSLLELAGFGVALSFGLVHLATIVAVIAHRSPAVVLAALGFMTIALAARVVARGGADVIVTADEVIVLALVALLGIPLYLQGSPFAVYEDQVLAALVRRLSELPAPAIDNLYVAPGVVYTYPFPGALDFMALVARLGDIDPLFVYHKLRFLWGPAALLMLYLGARAVFGHASIAAAVAVAAALFVGTGVFASVAGFPAWWAQLVPYSYAPDVAMTVLLPALLVMAFHYVQAAAARERAFFLAGTASLVLMLTMIHIREVVQFAVYLGCFVVVSSIKRPLRASLRPALTLLATTVAIALAYTLWQRAVVPVANDIVRMERQNLVSLAGELPARSLLLSPAAEVLGDFVQDFDELFRGLTPFFLLAGPLVIVLFRHRPLVWLIAASTPAYLAVMSVPLLAIPYIYVTYFEMLHVPVRNVIWFIYLLGGALLYVAALAVAQSRPVIRPLLLVATGAVGGIAGLLATTTLNQSMSGFVVPAIAAYALAFVISSSVRLRADDAGRTTAGRHVRRGPAVPAHYLRGVLGVVMVLALIALWPERAAVPRSDQVTIRWETALSDERRMALERRFSLGQPERRRDVPADQSVWNYRVTDLSVDNVRAIVQSPEVVDTHFIDRSTFRVEPQPPPGDDPPLGIVYATWLQYPATLVIVGVAVGIWAMAFPGQLVAASAIGRWSMTAKLDQPFYRFALPFALVAVPFAFWSARPALSPLALAPMPPAGLVTTPQALFDAIPCATTPEMPARFAEERVILPERTTCAPDYDVVRWVRQHVPVEAVFAVDRWTPYPPQVFMSPQAVVFPTLDASFIHEQSLFREYYRLFDDRIRRHGVQQPFFNTLETAEERAEFVRTLGVTHVLVSPVHHAALRPVLDSLPDQYRLLYERGGWAVYETSVPPQ